VPLSEEELRLLEQMERALVEEDPKFASTLRGSAFRHSARRRAVFAGVVFVGGVTLLMSGAVLRIPILGIAGFLVMLLSATVALTAIRGHQSAQSAEAAPGPDLAEGRQPKTGSFMERLEGRWRRRRDDGL
jgi:hypothetical protein